MAHITNRVYATARAELPVRDALVRARAACFELDRSDR